MYTYAQADFRVQRAQLAQLQQLNVQLQAQQTEAQTQRYLSDVLLTVSQAADRVERTLGRDVLAAGILAHRWLQTTHWVHAGLFSDFGRKRAWEQCRAVLDRARDQLWNGGAEAQLANAYLQLEDRMAELTALFQGDPRTSVQRIANESRSKAWWSKAYGIGAAAVAGGALLFSMLLLIGGGADALLVVWFFAGVVLFALGSFSLQARAQAKAAAVRYAQLAESCAELEALQSSENGARWLEKFRAEHPLLVRAPAPESAPSSVSHVVERQTIERQVVVARCKFCGQLTPVDHPRCGNCGGDKPL
jgi:hypothetical protein